MAEDHRQLLLELNWLAYAFFVSNILPTCSRRSSELPIDYKASRRTLELASGLFATATRGELRNERRPTKGLKNTTRKASRCNSERAETSTLQEKK